MSTTTFGRFGLAIDATVNTLRTSHVLSVLLYNVNDDDDDTVLIEGIKSHLDWGVDVSQKAPLFQHCPLALAVIYRSKRVVQYMLALEGVNLDVRSKSSSGNGDQLSLVRLAISFERYDILDLLLPLTKKRLSNDVCELHEIFKLVFMGSIYYFQQSKGPPLSGPVWGDHRVALLLLVKHGWYEPREREVLFGLWSLPISGCTIRRVLHMVETLLIAQTIERVSKRSPLRVLPLALIHSLLITLFGSAQYSRMKIDLY
jgi:hypothetical protein